MSTTTFDLSPFAINDSYKLSFVLSAFDTTLSQNTAHKALLKVFVVNGEVNSLVSLAPSGTVLVSPLNVHASMSYLAINGSGKTRNVASSFLERFGRFSVQDHLVVMTMEEVVSEEEEEEEVVVPFENNPSIVNVHGVRVDKAQLCSTTYRVFILYQIAASKGVTCIPTVEIDGDTLFKLSTLGFLIGDYASSKSFNDMLVKDHSDFVSGE